jgi:hypothetical protein
MVSFVRRLAARLFLGINSLAGTQLRYRGLLGGDYEEYRTKRESKNFLRPVACVEVTFIIDVAGFVAFGKLAHSPGPWYLFYEHLRLLHSINATNAFVFLAAAVVLGLGTQKGSRS